MALHPTTLDVPEDRDPRYPLPSRLFLLTAAAIFIGEMIVMLVLTRIPPLSTLAEALLDGIMITALMVPFLYLFLYKPMVVAIHCRRRAEEALRVLNRDLEKRVDERTRDLTLVNERLEKEISEKRQAQDEIWKDQDFIRSVVEAIPSLLVIYDVAARRCVFANTRVEDLLGYPNAEVFEAGRDFLKDILSPEDYSRLIQELLEPAERGGSAKDLGEIRLRQRSGEWRQMSARYKVLRSDPLGQGVVILFAAMEC